MGFCRVVSMNGTSSLDRAAGGHLHDRCIPRSGHPTPMRPRGSYPRATKMVWRSWTRRAIGLPTSRGTIWSKASTRGPSWPTGREALWERSTALPSAPKINRKIALGVWLQPGLSDSFGRWILACWMTRSTISRSPGRFSIGSSPIVRCSGATGPLQSCAVPSGWVAAARWSYPLNAVAAWQTPRSS